MEVEVPITEELLEKILSCIDKNTVLIGGQALSFWVSHYNISLTDSSLIAEVTHDADFLGLKSDIESISKKLHGKTIYPTEREMTSLIGQVKINLSPKEFVNIDVLHKLMGIPADDVRRRATEVFIGSSSFLVMNPLDVLLSRVENLLSIDGKRNEHGIEQAKIATLVAKSYILQLSQENNDDYKHALRSVERVATIAKSSAGKNASKCYGISFINAIPFSDIKNDNFNLHRLPRLLDELKQSSGLIKLQSFSDKKDMDLINFLKNKNYLIQVPKTNYGNYNGNIIWANGSHAVQLLSIDHVIVHDILNWKDKPITHLEPISIIYKSGEHTLHQPCKNKAQEGFAKSLEAMQSLKEHEVKTSKKEDKFKP